MTGAQGFLERCVAGDSYLRRALEALLDLARHVLAKGFGRAPAEYGEVARQLGEVGVVNSELAARLSLMAGYRNRMVHFYDEITDQELFAILTGELGDIEAVIAGVTSWLADHPDFCLLGHVVALRQANRRWMQYCQRTRIARELCR